jgi:hypothetical protein
MKTKITINPSQSVTVEMDADFSGERFERTYFVRASDGLGYVYYTEKNGRVSQICDGMADRGITLMASRDSLPTVLRREIRKARRAQTE